MLTLKNLIKILFLITATVLIQLEVIREKGHWVAGGNLAFPILLAILLWWPSYFKKLK
nr:MAG TPA: YvrJ protein family protein [Caudoviricetes sp.]